MSKRQMKLERPGGPVPAASVWDAPDPSGQMATVTSGPYAEALPVAGMTVAQIRSQFRDRLDLDPTATARIDGHDEVGEDTILRAGQLLMFGRRAGEKGGRSCRAS